MKISTIDGYGGRFNFEPPVETGERKVQTLRDLAVVAFVGDRASDFIVEAAGQNVDMLLRFSASDPQLVRAALAKFLEGKHEVTLDQ